MRFLNKLTVAAAFFVMVCGVFVSAVQAAEPVDGKVLETVIKMPPASVKFVEGLDGEKLFDDLYFFESLSKLMDSKDLGSVDKVAAFYLMQKKIGWGFAGAVFMAQHTTYYKYFVGKAAFFMSARKFFDNKFVNVGPFVDVATENVFSNPLLSANAMLLVGVLNADRAKLLYAKMLKPNYLLKSRNPSILNHYLCLGSVIAMNPEIAALLNTNLSLFASEEACEDIVCALGARLSFSNMKFISNYLERLEDSRKQLVVYTCYAALKEYLDPDLFRKVVLDVLKNCKSAWVKDILFALYSEPKSSLYPLTDEDQQVVKLWDGFTAVVFEDGLLIDDKNGFREFFWF